MAKSFFAVVVLTLFFAAGCAEKKANPAKLDEAAKLISSKEFEKGITILDELGKTNPNDEALKKAKVDAHMKYGNYIMYESPLLPREKYPAALHQYRLVVAIEPTHAKAKQNIGKIEGIYNQMGRTTPQ